MELRIMRDGIRLFQSSEIIDWSFDALSVSGIDYWSQEARQAKLTLFYTPALEALLEGPYREVAAGFHTLSFRILDSGRILFTGVLPEGDFSLEYLSLSDKKVELNLLDYFGLLIKLSEDRESHVGNPTHPLEALSFIVSSCFNEQTEDERNNGAPASVIRLKEAVGVSAAVFTDSYFPGTWLPWHVVNHQLYNYASDSFISIPVTPLSWLGFITVNGLPCIYFRQFWSYYGTPVAYNGISSSYHAALRIRVYSLAHTTMSLIQQTDLYSHEQPIMNDPAWVDPLPVTDFIASGTSEYRVQGSAVLFSGYAVLSSLETVPGWYKCKDLLAEYLRLSHAVILFESGNYRVRNRLDDTLPLFRILDPLSFTMDEIEPQSPLSSSPISVASLALIEAVDNYYSRFLSLRGLLHEAEITILDSQLPELIPLSDGASVPSNPYDLISCRFWFDNRTIYIKEVDYDISSGEISLRGWC